VYPTGIDPAGTPHPRATCAQRKTITSGTQWTTRPSWRSHLDLSNADVFVEVSAWAD
jgi:hypothetical protein